MSTSRLLSFLMLMNILLAGCSHRHAPEPASGHSSHQATYQTQGVVREISVDRRTARIAHEAIPGFMPRMTMNFTVLEPSELEFVSVGDQIQFELRVTETDHWIFHIRKEGTVSVPSPSPAQLVAPPELAVGDLFPNPSLINEQAQTIHPSDFRGRAVALTFIFTRCPLPNFCPRMSMYFRDTLELLSQKPWPKELQSPAFLSLSFDPDHDQPEQLKRYASIYRRADLHPWIFATIPKAELNAFTAQCGLNLEIENGSIAHNLRTLVLTPEGKVSHIFKGNEWTAEQLYDALRDAAKSKPASAAATAAPQP